VRGDLKITTSYYHGAISSENGDIAISILWTHCKNTGGHKK